MEYSEFATADAFIREGFDRIVGPIGLADDLRSALFADYAHAHKSGDPRAEGAAFAKRLSGIDWRWPWFEEWYQHFAALGAWPRLWRLIQHEADLPPSPVSIPDAAAHFKLQELRQWVKDRGVTLSRSPRSKAEYSQVLAAEVPWEDFRPLADRRHAERASNAREADVRGKAELLAHTVTVAVFKARDRDRYFKALSVMRGNDWFFQLMPVADEPEPVNALIQRFFDEKFVGGRGLWPPYFPGDSTLIVLTRPEWEEAHGRKLDIKTI